MHDFKDVISYLLRDLSLFRSLKDQQHYTFYVTEVWENNFYLPGVSKFFFVCVINLIVNVLFQKRLLVQVVHNQNHIQLKYSNKLRRAYAMNMKIFLSGPTAKL